MRNDTFPQLLMDRLEFALGKIEMSAAYRELMLSIASRNLAGQFQNTDSRTPFVLLPSMCCQACGEAPERSIGVTAAWFLLQVSAHLLDKVEDEELNLVGPAFSNAGVITNLTTGMIFVAQWILNHLELDCVDAGAAWDIQRAFHETVLSVCSGQHLDLSVTLPDLTTCWQIAEAKSGAAFSLACYTGARLATCRSDILDGLQQFGRHLGTIVQISDDLEDVIEIGNSNFGQRIDKTLVGAYMSFVECTSSEAPANVLCDSRQESIQQKIIRKGSVLYLQLESLKYAALAENELKRLKLANDFYAVLMAIVYRESRLGSTIN